ncbi:zinc finger domain-containing protein [Streptomyces rishiriensis]|uniref:zinc finger domain-containing protein n=1 Tax=Streptomyces rishiriensis TaxID=68264 RepID=UPI00131EEA27|nr:hypothetical protein [Streptomyces rishiriensis]
MNGNPPAWQVRCPWCGAPPGSRCTSPRGRRLHIDTHDARTTAWNTRTKEPE